MKSRIWILFVVLAGLCWGTYVPLVAFGGGTLQNPFASFLCVGVAYFLIAVLFPVVIMSLRKRWPNWSRPGVAFATLAGVAGAMGALCVILAAGPFKGDRMFIAPVIFSTAPVINTVFSLFWQPEKGALAFGLPHVKPHWTLYLGILLAALGAGLVLYSKEKGEYLEKQEKLEAAKAAAEKAGETAPAPHQETGYVWILFVLLGGLCWGTYVPLIAQGGKELKNSYASFLCVGVAYFLLAVLIPLVLMSVGVSNWDWTSNANLTTGAISATLAGVAGALGALCVIFATFEFKGPKLFVAPLIFTFAPIINTLVSQYWHPTQEPMFGPPHRSPLWEFYFGIVAAGLGAGLVLFAKEYGEWKHAAKPPEVKP